ncbi:unnamed protein product [Sphagnum jensenii]|uniref:Uncharacterized protein n=1 Tax=Sphagnum jensenii TaxID=128206 RepID=A0ABP0VFV2_9BRYO
MLTERWRSKHPPSSPYQMPWCCIGPTTIYEGTRGSNVRNILCSSPQYLENKKYRQEDLFNDHPCPCIIQSYLLLLTPLLCQQKKHRKIDTVLHAAIRVTECLKKADSIKSYLNSPWRTIETNISLRLSLICYNALTAGQPKGLSRLLELRQCSRNLRSDSLLKFNVPMARTTWAKRAFRTSGPRTISSLSVKKEWTKSFKCFKNCNIKAMSDE